MEECKKGEMECKQLSVLQTNVLVCVQLAFKKKGQREYAKRNGATLLNFFAFWND